MRTREDLRKQFEIEKYWRNRILTSKHGTDREAVIKQAYSEVNEHMDEFDHYHENLKDRAIAQFSTLQLIIGADQKPVFLDVGCASGALVLLALSHGWEAFGFDPENNALEIANERLLASGLSGGQRFTDSLEGFDDNSFDIIFHSDVLEHIHPEDAKDFIAKQFNLLRKGGMLVINTPYRLCGPKDISKYFLPLGSQAQGLHLKEYFLSEMVRLYSDAGFEKTVTFMGLPRAERQATLSKRNTNIKLLLEKVLILINTVRARYLASKISQRLGYSLTVAIK